MSRRWTASAWLAHRAVVHDLATPVREAVDCRAVLLLHMLTALVPNDVVDQMHTSGLGPADAPGRTYAPPGEHT